MLKAKGLSVKDFTLRTSALNASVSGNAIEGTIPSPPAFETAAAKSPNDMYCIEP